MSWWEFRGFWGILQRSLEGRNAVRDASRLPAVRFGVSECRKGRLLFQTAFVYAISFAGVIAFGYSSVSGGASFLRT